MKGLIATVVALLAFSVAGVANAGNPSLCAKGGWTTAQSASGGSFASLPECAKAKEVYRPTLAIDPTAVTAGERFTLTATGFHPNAGSTVYFAITGQAPYGSYVPFYPTEADGSFSITFTFAACGNSPDYLTLTLVDSYGVHASVALTLC